MEIDKIEKALSDLAKQAKQNPEKRNNIKKEIDKRKKSRKVENT